MPVVLHETPSQQSDRHKRSTDAFTAALMLHHADLCDIPEQPEPLPPIPNREIAIACAVAFTPRVLNRVAAIQQATLREWPNLTLADLKAQRRTMQVVYARQIAMYLCKKLTPNSLPDIGRRFGGRDHTTVLHAVRKIEALVAKDMVLAATVERIKDRIPEFMA
jgi:hypothetical protein